ncbi:hypothetical protein D3C87_2045300 [compost metagenome]
MTARIGEEDHHVLRRGQVDEQGNDERKGADDNGGCLGFHRQCLDLGLHLLAVAQHF